MCFIYIYILWVGLYNKCSLVCPYIHVLKQHWNFLGHNMSTGEKRVLDEDMTDSTGNNKKIKSAIPEHKSPAILLNEYKPG